MVNFEFTQPSGKDALRIIAVLNSTLSQLTGNEGHGSQFEENFDSKTDAFLLVELDGEPIACGGFRHIDKSCCELKRVFSKHKGYGSRVLSALEIRADELGYREILVVTRRINREAIEFYTKYGYVETTLPEKYSDPGRSICLNKTL